MRIDIYYDMDAECGFLVFLSNEQTHLKCTRGSSWKEFICKNACNIICQVILSCLVPPRNDLNNSGTEMLYKAREPRQLMIFNLI